MLSMPALPCSRGEMSTPAASDDLVTQIDRVQYETGEGPCVETATEHATVRSDDLRAGLDTRDVIGKAS